MVIYALSEKKFKTNIEKFGNTIQVKYVVSPITGNVYVKKMKDKGSFISIYYRDDEDTCLKRSTFEIHHTYLSVDIVLLYIIVDDEIIELGEFEEVIKPFKITEDIKGKKVIHISGMLGPVSTLRDGYKLLYGGKANDITPNDVIDIVESKQYLKHNTIKHIMFYIAIFVFVILAIYVK